MVYYEMKKIFSKTSGRIAVICLIGLLIVVCGFAVSGVSKRERRRCGQKAEGGKEGMVGTSYGRKDWGGDRRQSCGK